MRFAYTAICIYEDAEKTKLIPIGGIGVSPSGQSMNKKAVKLVGYWIGEPYWGRGIVTEALQLITNYAFTQQCADAINDGTQIVRLEAAIFAFNAPSGRVLQKAGYQLEAIQKAAYIKLGQIQDAHLYVKIRDGI
jgi:[ribosomal protein S5]-alanine N-acetyltransferase